MIADPALGKSESSNQLLVQQIRRPEEIFNCLDSSALSLLYFNNLVLACLLPLTAPLSFRLVSRTVAVVVCN